MYEIITLSTTEKEWARDVAVLRQGDGKRKDRDGARGGLALHLPGAMGELAVAKFLGIEWPARVDTFHGPPDLDPDIEVKTRQNHAWGLMIRHCDPVDNRRYILVTKEIGNPEFRLHGWINGSEIRTDEHWNTEITKRNGRPPMWLVEQHELNPMKVLRMALEG